MKQNTKARTRVIPVRLNDMEQQMVGSMRGDGTVSDVIRAGIRMMYASDPTVRQNAMSEPAREQEAM